MDFGGVAQPWQAWQKCRHRAGALCVRTEVLMAHLGQRLRAVASMAGELRLATASIMQVFSVPLLFGCAGQGEIAALIGGRGHHFVAALIVGACEKLPTEVPPSIGR